MGLFWKKSILTDCHIRFRLIKAILTRFHFPNLFWVTKEKYYKKLCVIDQSGASLYRLFRKSSKMATKHIQSWIRKLVLNCWQEDRLISEMTNDTNFDDILASLNIANTQQNTQPSCVLPVDNTVNLQSTMSNFQSFAGLPTINNYGNINIIPKWFFNLSYIPGPYRKKTCWTSYCWSYYC